jgi:hypothetical protein
VGSVIEVAPRTRGSRRFDRCKVGLEVTRGIRIRVTESRRPERQTITEDTHSEKSGDERRALTGKDVHLCLSPCSTRLRSHGPPCHGSGFQTSVYTLLQSPPSCSFRMSCLFNFMSSDFHDLVRPTKLFRTPVGIGL